MKRFLARNSWVLGFVIAFAPQAAQFKFPNQTLTVPDGFEVQLVGASPLVDRPISAAFDDQGRLHVTDSSGSNDKPDKQLAEKPHRVVRLEDTDGDGRFDKTTVFADKVMFPEGCMWYDGSLYVSAPPSIWKLTDTNSDGVADVRTEWHEGKTLTGCANDLHGPFLGLDGWIYWCKGAFAKQTYDRPGKEPFASRAAHIFRSPPDHSYIEPVLTGGMDNPVGVAFTPEGERILCGTFFAPGEPGHRDGLIHAIYGGVYGKNNDVNDDHKKTGDLMPVMTHMGPAAPCSVIRYESRIFGEEYRDNLFVCAFNLHKVTRHLLEPVGASFKTKDSDFVTSDNTDFHPTDVLEDADGSLLVVDTGGWYKICCPTSQLSKPEVLGAIYRIRRTGAKKLDDALGLKLAWRNMKPPELTGLLGDERIFVQRRAMHELGKRGEEAVVALKGVVASAPKEKEAKNKQEGFEEFKRIEKARTQEWPKGAAQRQKALWSLTRIDSIRAREAVRLGLGDPDFTVRSVALQSASLHRDRSVADQFLPNDSREDRIYLELIGRVGGCDTRLLEYAHDNDMRTSRFRPSQDRVLQHSFTYAIIESEATKAARSFLTDPLLEDLRPAALIALDQMDNGGLKAETVVPLLASEDADLKKAANWVAGHHPDWGGALAGYFRGRLEGVKESDRSDLERQLAQFAKSQEIQELMVSSLNQPPPDSGGHQAASRATASVPEQTVLHAMALASLKEPPTSWSGAVKSCLSQNDEAVLRAAVGTARALSQAKTNVPSFSEALLRIANNEAHPADLRLEALAALPNGLRTVEPDLLSFLCSNLDPAKPVMTRSAATSVLAKSKLKDEQLLALADTLKTAGPLEVTKLLTAYEHSTNEAVGLKLVTTLKESKSLASLRTDLFKTLIAKYPASVQQQGNELLTLRNVDTAKQSAHLDELLAELKNGDIRRGQAVFNSQKAACFSCHAMGYQGGHVGPDLTSISQARTERDLLEAIVYPSASFVRSFEPIIVQTKSDEQYNGVLRKDAPDEVVLATGPETEVRIARSDITEMRPGTISIMPAGLDQQLSKQELADLLAFLKATKWGPR